MERGKSLYDLRELYDLCIILSLFILLKNVQRIYVKRMIFLQSYYVMSCYLICSFHTNKPITIHPRIFSFMSIIQTITISDLWFTIWNRVSSYQHVTNMYLTKKKTFKNINFLQKYIQYY